MKAYDESRLTDMLIEFDEMGFCPTTVCPHPEQYAIEWKEQIAKEIQKLQAENAELRARLEKAVELPYMYEAELVDSAGHFLKTIYIVLYNNNGTIQAIQYSYKKVAEARFKDLAVCEGDKG